MAERPLFMPCLGLTTWVFRAPGGITVAGVCSSNQIAWYRAHGCEVAGS